MSTNANQNLWVWIRLRGLRQFIAGTTRAAMASQQVSGSITNMGRNTRTTSMLMFKSLQYIRRGFIALTATAGLGAVAMVRGFTSFENQMRAVQAVTRDSTGAQRVSYETMTDAAIKAASVTKFSNQEAAEGLYILASAGFTARESTESLLGTLRLAQATNASVKTSAYVLASAMNTYELSADRAAGVANILTRGVARSALEMDDIQYAFKYAAGPAKNLGVSIKDLTAALALLADRGTKGRTAGTSLRMAFIRLVNPPKAAKKALKDMNLEVKDFQDSAGNFLPVFDIFEKIRKGSEGMTKAQREAALSALVGANSYSAFTKIIDAGPKVWKDYQRSMGDAKITAKGVGEDMQKTVGAAIENTGNIIQGILFRPILKYSPQIQAAVRSIGDGAQWVEKNWDKIVDVMRPFGDMIVSIARIVWPFVKYGLIAMVIAAIALRKIVVKINPVLEFLADNMDIIAPLVLAVVGGFVAYKVAMAAGLAITKAWTIATKVMAATLFFLRNPMFVIRYAMLGLNAAFLANPVGITILAIIALGAAFVVAYKKIGWFRDAVNATWSWIKDNWQGVLRFLTLPIYDAVAIIAEHWDTITGKTKAMVGKLKEIFTAIKDWLKPILTSIATIAGNVIKTVYNAIAWAWNKVSDIFEPIKDRINDIYPGPNFPSIPKMPQLWQGGSITGGGYAMVGERGPEIQYMPAGARVEPLPAGQARFDLDSIGGGGGPIITKVYLDGRQIAEAVHSEVQKRKARA